jgi:mono/diheme cytochrome c family protein
MKNAIVVVWIALLGASTSTLSADRMQPPDRPPSTPAAGDAEKGRRLYREVFCYACHGTEGQGSRDGVRIGGTPPSLAVFRSYLRKPSGNMPAYTSKVLSDEEVVDIHAFLRSLPKPPDVDSIPLLKK